jgi:large subunit ribosomal protein L28
VASAHEYTRISCLCHTHLCRYLSIRDVLLRSLDNHSVRGILCAPVLRPMSKVCAITGSKPTRGSVIHRRGMAKKKGGVGRHVTKNVLRLFAPNLHEHRIWVPELKKFVRVRMTARGLKTINKNGAYKALKKAGAI